MAPADTVRVSLERDGRAWQLVLQIDEAWLKPVLERGEVTLDPIVGLPQAVQDTAIESDAGWQDVDQHTDEWLRVGGDSSFDTRGLLKFDVENVVPQGADITRASMYLYSAFDITGATKTIGVFQAQTPWVNGATWNTRDGSIPWVTGGGDPAATAESTQTIPDPYVWSTFGLTALARKWSTGTENTGVVVRSTDNATANNYYGFASSEFSDPDGRPAMDVAYRLRVGARSDHAYVDQPLTDRETASVDVGTGNLLLSSNDLNVAGTGLDVGFQRTYQSRMQEGPLSSFSKTGISTDVWLDRAAQDGTIAFNDASQTNYRLQPQPGGSTFRGEGLQATLTRNADDTWDLVYDGTDRRLRFPAFATGENVSALAWEQDRNANRITYNRDADKTLTSIVDTQGRTLTLDNNPYGPINKITDFTGRSVQYEYNSSAELTKMTAPTGAVTTYAYSTDGRSNLTAINTPGGGRTVVGYDGEDRVTSLTRVDNTTTGAGATWNFSYTTTLTAPCDVAPPGVKFTLQSTVTDPRGKQTRYCLDAQQRVRKSRDPRGYDSEKAFNPLGYVTKIDSPGATASSSTGVQSTYAYNSDSAITSITRGGAGSQNLTTSYGYSTGRTYQPQSTTSPQGNSKTFGYDTAGNTTSTKRGAPGSSGGEQVSMTYNAKGLVTSSTDPNGRVTSYSYDTAGNPTGITPPAPLGATAITTDSLSRIKTVTDGKGQTKTFTYDALDRVTKVDFAGGTSTAFAFDGAGNTVSRVDAPASGLAGLTTYQFDLRNRLKKATQPDYQWTEYAYDLTGNLASLKDQGGTTSYTYDDANLLASVQEPGGGSPATFEHNPQGNRTKTTLPNGIVVETPYDGAGRLSSITAKKGTTLLQSRALDYQKSGNETELIQKVTDGTTATTTTYAYDELDRLTSASGVGGSQASAYSYQLDPAGNRLQESRKDPGATTPTVTNWTYNNANQPATKNGSPAGYTFDANGNETGNGAGRTQTYNVKDQTTSVTAGGTSTALSHLGTSQEDLGQIGSQRIVQDALGVAYEPKASGSWTHYTRTSQGDYLGQRTSSKSYFLTDERGSIVALTNAAGAKTADYRYDPYGRTIGTPHGTLGYVSGEQTPGGLTHFGARYYDPTVGRWTQQDPLDQASDLQQVNLYGYAALDPVNRTDPTGECAPRTRGSGPVPARCQQAYRNRVRKYALPLYCTTGAVGVSVASIVSGGTAAGIAGTVVSGYGGTACGFAAASAND